MNNSHLDSDHIALEIALANKAQQQANNQARQQSATHVYKEQYGTQRTTKRPLSIGAQKLIAICVVTATIAKLWYFGF